MPKRSGILSTTPDTLIVAENSAPTPIGIVAPTDSGYPSSKLTITVTALPSDGTIFLSDGITPIYLGEKLTVSQLTGLKFQPKLGLFGVSSTFTYKVTDPSGLSAIGSATLSISPASIPPTITPCS